MNCEKMHLALHPARIDGTHTVCLDCGEHVIVTDAHYADGQTPEEQARELRTKCDAALSAHNVAHVIESIAGLLHGKAIPCRRPKEGHSCIRREDARPLTKDEIKKGWARRPFSSYNPINLCNGCAAYWYTTMAGIALRDAARWADIEAAYSAKPPTT